MISRALSRRLEQLEACLRPADEEKHIIVLNFVDNDRVAPQMSSDVLR